MELENKFFKFLQITVENVKPFLYLKITHIHKQTYNTNKELKNQI
jgi:hypothetical protein